MRVRPFRVRLPDVDALEWVTPTTSEVLTAAGATDRGKRRANNEDSWAVAPLARDRGTLLVVADGLGGAAGGEVASRTAVDALLDCLVEHPLPDDLSPAEALKQSVVTANEALRERAQIDPRLAEFGTTVTAALVMYPDLWLAHVGDSRAYIWSRGHLEQLTRDHTMAEKMRQQGMISRAQHVPRWESMLWNALGPNGEEPQIDEHHRRLERGERLLLCSDGLTLHLSDADLARQLARASEPATICRELVDAANKAGGEDNITAVVARTNGR